MKRMEGGRIGHSETVGVEHDDALPPIPPEIDEFRNILHDYKEKILDSLTPQDIDTPPERAQDMSLIDSATYKIQRLSNILKSIISDSNDEIDYTKVMVLVLHPNNSEDERNQLMEDIDSIFRVFKNRKLPIDKLRKDNELQGLCIHFLDNDLDKSTFSLKNQHLN
jgi:hypothetical protein